MLHDDVSLVAPTEGVHDVALWKMGKFVVYREYCFSFLFLGLMFTVGTNSLAGTWTEWLQL